MHALQVLFLTNVVRYCVRRKKKSWYFSCKLGDEISFKSLIKANGHGYFIINEVDEWVSFFFQLRLPST